MSVARSVAEVLGDHVTLELEGIDRLYCNMYVPKLQHELGVVSFFRFHRGYTFASSALMDPISKAFVAAIGRFVAARSIPVVIEADHPHRAASPPRARGQPAEYAGFASARADRGRRIGRGLEVGERLRGSLAEVSCLLRRLDLSYRI